MNYMLNYIMDKSILDKSIICQSSLLANHHCLRNQNQHDDGHVLFNKNFNCQNEEFMGLWTVISVMTLT